MAACCNSCGQCSKCLGTSVQNIFDIINPLINDGEPLVQLQSKNLPLVETDMFDVQFVTMPNGDQHRRLVFKNFRGDSNSFVRTNDQCQAVWYETCVSDLFKTTVAVAAVASNTLVVTDVNQFLGAAAGSTIQVSTATGLVTVTILSINVGTNTITLAPGQTITAAVDDCVERVGYVAAISCTDLYDNQVTLPSNRKQYTAPFKRFVITHDIIVCEINFDRLGGEASTRQRLSSRKQIAEEFFMNQILHSIYFDDGAVAENLRGLFPAIKQAQATCNKSMSYDFIACCDPLDVCLSMERQISTFLDIIEHVTASGAYTSDAMVKVQVNRAQWKLLNLAQKYFFENQMISRVNMDGEDAIVYSLPKIVYAGFVVEFKYNPMLDKIRDPFFFIMPNDAMMIVQKAFSGVNEDLGTISNTGSLFSGDTPMIKYIDRTAFETNGFGDCVRLKGFIDLAVIWKHVDSCAYFMGKNFGLCADVSCGDVCLPATRFDIV